MNEPALSDAYWAQPPILSTGERPAGIRDTRPADADIGVLDSKTFSAIEADQLFDSVNHAATHAGQCVLYRSLARPGVNAAVVRDKQDAVRELESNSDLCQSLQKFIDAMAREEQSLYQLLHGTFIGGLAIDSSRVGKEDMEFSGYGYHQFVDGTDFVVDLVETVKAFPQPQSRYLQALFATIRNFEHSRVYSLISGPVYLSGGKFKTREEKSPYMPLPRFRPSMIKPLPMLLALAAIGGALYFFQGLLASFGIAYLGYGVLALLVPLLPILLIAIAASDRDSVIYPLRKLFKHSPELARVLDTLGMMDEILSIHRYSKSLGGSMTLPEILEGERHLLSATAARNPILGRTNPNYVPNDVLLD